MCMPTIAHVVAEPMETYVESQELTAESLNTPGREDFNINRECSLKTDSNDKLYSQMKNSYALR
jgi:hypothetical protein